MKRSQNVMTAMILWAMAICLCACGRSEKAERENTSGILQKGCFYEDNIITLSAMDRFMYSEWEPAGFEYICTDPTCSHLSDSCSAWTFHDNGGLENGGFEKNLCVVYQDRLVILDSYEEHVDHDSYVMDGVTNLDVSYVWHTDVYEADLDGRNRKCKLSFAGSIGSVTATSAAVMQEGVLYFGGPIESRIIMEYDDTGAVSRNEVIHSDAFYALDLEDYSVELFAETEGKDSMSYSYYVGIFDGYVYARASESWWGSGIWYRINMETGEWKEIVHFDSNAPWFLGAIGDAVYYYYDDKPILYVMDVGTQEEREVLAMEQDRAFVVAAVMENQIWVMTDYSMEEGSYMSEYTVLNKEDDVVDFCHYDEYILFYGVVGDRLIYSKNMFSNEEMWWVDEEMWWADKSDIADLTERGVYIGHADGRYNDPIFYSAD